MLTGLFGGDSTVGGLLETGLNYLFTQDSLDDQRDLLEQGFEMQNPWATSGGQGAAIQTLQELMVDPSRISDTPGYQFALDQGMEALHARQAASGHRFSGRAMEEVAQFSTGLASQMYNQEMNRYAQLAGATQGITGGVTTGQNLSSLSDQESFNQGYLLNQLFNTNWGNDTLFGGGGGSTAPSNQNWLDPFGEDSTN